MSSVSGHGQRVPFSKAIDVRTLGPCQYRVNLDDSFCVGSVPNGGYTAACMVAAARVHMLKREQPDVLTAHFEYPTRTSSGPAIVTVDEVKLGRRVSTLHLTLWQDGLLTEEPWITPSVSRRVALAYTNHLNLRAFDGPSMPVGYEVSEAAKMPSLPVTGLDRIVAGVEDPFWELHKAPKQYLNYVRTLLNWNFIMPRESLAVPGVLDLWASLASGEKITQSTLPYLVDSFPFNVHMHIATPELRKIVQNPFKSPPSDSSGDDGTDTKKARAAADKERAGMWFPTVAMNMEVKMALPEEGVEWIAVQLTSKQIRHGKMDIHGMVRTLDGELVALSEQTALMLSSERNLAKRGSASKPSL